MLLETKQVMGGSSLKKLQTMIDTSARTRLHDQYLHCGAGATYRTTGRGVQMQNLKRLNGEGDDMSSCSTMPRPVGQRQAGREPASGVHRHGSGWAS